MNAVSLRPLGSLLAVLAAVLAWHGVAGPHLFDTGELVAAAWALGGSHPPGQPLHALLGHAALLVPLGPITWRITLLSIAGAVAAAYLCARLVGLLLATGPYPAATAAPPRGPMIAAGLAVFLSPPVLRQAVRPEVYTPALALTTGALVLLWRWASAGPRGGHAGLRCAALLAGLVTALHPPHGIAVFAVALVLLVVARRDTWRRPRAMAGAVGFGVLGLLVHLYLPVRARAGAPMWGDATTVRGLADYLTASAYRANLGTGADPLTTAGDAMIYLLHASGVTPLLGLGLATWWGWRRNTHGRAWMLGILGALPAAASAALLQPLEKSNPDNVAYFGPAVVWLVAAGVAGIAAWMANGRWGTAGPGAPVSNGGGFPRARWLAGAALSILVAVHPLALRHAPKVARADAPALHTLGTLLTHTPPPRALVVVETDFVASTWWAAREVEGARPDVALLATGLATSSWHWRSLAHHAAYDGTPIRGAGPDAWHAYVDGAVRGAQNAGAPVASEPGHPPGRGHGRVTGPYLVMDSEGDHVSDGGPMAERLWPHLDAEIAGGPEGDADAVGNVLRGQQLGRATRWLRRSGHQAEGFESLARALHFVPMPLRGSLGAVREPLRIALPPAVRDPDAFMVTRGDLVREAARWTFATGASEEALALLQWQAEGGDARALLQLAWLHMAGGRPDAARRTLAAFRDLAPSLVDEAATLSHHLAQASPQ